jgi:hypothetical protein
MSDASADARSGVSRQWIKAHVLGGFVFNAVAPIAYLVERWVGLETASPRSVESFVLGIGYGLAYSLSLIFLGYLIGIVLWQKIPLFPLRAWLILFGSLGLFSGLLTAAVSLDGASDFDKTGSSKLAMLAIGIFVTAFIGMMIGTIGGGLQAFVLRHAAEGLRTWIVYSVLAGLPFVIFAPIVVYDPLSGFAREVIDAVAGLFVTVAGAFIMLPAVLRLRPRADAR